MLFVMVSLVACGTSGSAPEVEQIAAPVKTAVPMASVVEVSEPRARAMPPGAPNSGGFMTLHNSGEAEAKLVGAAAAVSKSVELHTHVEEAGMMRMRQIPEIVVPPGQDVVLEPGGLHVMFIGLNAPLEQGNSFPLTLSFADGSTQAVEMPVQPIGMQGQGHGHGH